MTLPANVDMRGWHDYYPLSPRWRGGDPYNVSSGRQNIIFEDLFDSGILDSSHWYGSGNTPTVDQVNKRLIVSLERYVDPVSYRTEVVLHGLPTEYFDTGQNAKIGSTLWYGVSIFLPSDFVIDSTWEIIKQWHGVPDFHLGESYRNPNLSLGIVGDAYRLNVKADSKTVTPPSDPDRYTRETTIDIATVTPTIGKWTNWVFRVKWAYDNTGELTIYQNGVSIFSETGIGNCFNDVYGPYLKMGVYKGPWREGSPATDTDTRLYYYDNFRIGNENATISDVWEDHS